MSRLAMQGVRFAFAGWPPTVEGASLHVDEGEFHGLVGRSGCGKTTLLKLAAGLLQPDAGTVDFRPRDPQAPGRDIGFVFQAPTLLEWLRVVDNVLLPVTLHRPPTREDVARAEALLQQLGLAAHARRYPRQLSGGQQSRVALARALILQPSLLLLDEPFAALDAITREELQDDLLALVRAQRTAVLFVTHDIAEAVYLSDRIAVVEGGRVAREFAVALPQRAPGLRFDAEFARLCREVRAALHLEGAGA